MRHLIRHLLQHHFTSVLITVLIVWVVIWYVLMFILSERILQISEKCDPQQRFLDARWHLWLFVPFGLYFMLPKFARGIDKAVKLKLKRDDINTGYFTGMAFRVSFLLVVIPELIPLSFLLQAVFFTSYLRRLKKLNAFLDTRLTRTGNLRRAF